MQPMTPQPDLCSEKGTTRGHGILCPWTRAGGHLPEPPHLTGRCPSRPQAIPPQWTVTGGCIRWIGPHPSSGAKTLESHMRTDESPNLGPCGPLPRPAFPRREAAVAWGCGSAGPGVRSSLHGRGSGANLTEPTRSLAKPPKVRFLHANQAFSDP